MEKLREKQLSGCGLSRKEITYTSNYFDSNFYWCEGQQFKEVAELFGTKVAKEMTPFRYKIKYWAKMANVR